MYMTVFEMSKDSLRRSRNFLNLKNGNTVHRWITSRQHSRRDEGEILYRIMQQNNSYFLYVQSKDPFNVSDASEYGLTLNKSFNVEKMFENLAVGDRIVFNTVVTPVRVNKAGSGKKEFIQNYIDRQKWVNRKFHEGGLKDVSYREEQIGQLAFTRNKTEIRVPFVEVSGSARIIDKEKFLQMVKAGVGKHKNFGAGLIMFRSVS